MTLFIGNACRRRMQECAQHLSKTRVNRQQFLSRVEEGRRRQFHATIGRWEPSRSDLGNHLQSTYGIDPKLHAGIFKALEPVYGPNLTVGHLDAFGKTGLAALAASVEQQLVKRRGAAKRPSRVLKVSIPHHKTSFEVDWKLGDSLLDVARSHDEMFAEYMEGTCGGNMSCCTCHVYIDQPEFQALLKAPEEAELDMLVGGNLFWKMCVCEIELQCLVVPDTLE